MGQINGFFLSYNSSGGLECTDITLDYNISVGSDLVYNYESCNEGIGLAGTGDQYPTDGVHDMFWNTGGVPNIFHSSTFIF